LHGELLGDVEMRNSMHGSHHEELLNLTIPVIFITSLFTAVFMGWHVHTGVHLNV